MTLVFGELGFSEMGQNH